jgi:hypothetical protein
MGCIKPVVILLRRSLESSYRRRITSRQMLARGRGHSVRSIRVVGRGKGSTARERGDGGVYDQDYCILDSDMGQSFSSREPAGQVDRDSSEHPGWPL